MNPSFKPNDAPDVPALRQARGKEAGRGGENYSYELHKFHFLPHQDQNVHGMFPSPSVLLRISNTSMDFLFLA